MHHFLGFGIDEWASLMAIGGAVLASIGWLLKKTFQPLQLSINNLSEKIQELNNANKERDKEFAELSHEFQQHLIHASVRDTKIKVLEKEVFGHDD